MSDIQYESQDELRPRQFAPARGGFDLTGMFVRWKIARDRNQASLVLLGIGGIACLIMIYALHALFAGPKSAATQDQINAAFRNGGASLPAKTGY